ncbi:MAG: BamA/TamA family outer membrane protein, partial [Bryobacteraceae bacterium]
DILPELHHDASTQQVHFDFRIQTGPRARYTQPVLPGAAEADIMRLVNATRWKRLWGLLGWRSVTASRTAQGMERMQDYYRDRHHLLARVDLEQMDYTRDTQRATPRVAVAPGPKVEVRVEGADLSTGRLRQLVPIEREQSADRDLLREGQRNIEEYYQEQGYFRVNVAYESRDEPDGRRVVVYTVDRGLRYRLKLLEISGNEYFDLTTIRERMNVLPATSFRFRQGKFSDALLRSDINSIRELYLSNGFLKVDIAPPRVVESYEGRENNLAVFLKVIEGPQTLVGDVKVEGLATEHETEVRGLLGAIQGQPFSETLVASDRDLVLNHYYNRGHPDASFQWSMSERGPETIDLRYQIEAGRRVYVRGVLVGGLQTSDPEMVQSRIPLNSGEPLSQLQLIESQRRLYDLGVFARVDVAVQNPEGLERSKYLLYQMEEARKYSFNMGIGAEVARIGRGDTFEAPAGEPGFSPRVSLGISRSNMFGVGHTASVQTRLSSIQQRALITYVAPRFKGYENVSLTITGMTDLSRDSNTFTVRRQEGSVQIGQRLSRANLLQYRFAYRRVAIDEGSLKIDPELIPVLAQNVRVGILSGTYIQDRRDDPIESRRGYLNSIDIGIASKAFASQTDYLRVLARNSTYHRLTGELILARSLTLGWQKNVGSGGAAVIPLAERFFSGGGASHRGFPDNQAGPRDLETGFPIGGSALAVNNLELRFPLLGDTLGGVAFHDAG